MTFRTVIFRSLTTAKHSDVVYFFRNHFDVAVWTFFRKYELKAHIYIYVIFRITCRRNRKIALLREQLTAEIRFLGITYPEKLVGEDRFELPTFAPVSLVAHMGAALNTELLSVKISGADGSRTRTSLAIYTHPKTF